MTTPPFGLTSDEWRFGLVISSVHGIQHLFYRLFPPLIPILVVGLDASLWQLGLLVSIYLFAGGLSQAPMGVLVDRFDRRYILLASIGLMSVGYLVFVLGSVAGSTLPSIQLFGHVFTGTYQIMAFGMFIAGVGYSGIHPVGYPLISANIGHENKGKLLGMWGSASKIGDTVAPLLIGGLILVVSWESILVGVSLFGFCYAGWLWLRIQRGEIETRPPSTHHVETAPADADGQGGVTATPRQFLVPMSTILLAFCFILFATNGLITFTPVFVTDVYGYSLSVWGVDIPSESVANAYFSVLLLSGAVSQLGVGVLADRFDYRLVLLALLASTTVGLGVLSLVTLTPLLLLVVFALVGGCLFGINPVRDALISDITPAAYEGRTFGSFWTIALLVSSAYPLVIGYLGDTVGIQASFQYLAVGTLAGMVGIGLLYSPRLYRRRAPTESTDASDAE